MAELQLAVNNLDFQPMVEETDEATKALAGCWSCAGLKRKPKPGNKYYGNGHRYRYGGNRRSYSSREASFKDFGNFALGQLANLFHQLGIIF